MTTSTFFFNGQQISAEAFIQKLFNTITLPSVLRSEEELKNYGLHQSQEMNYSKNLMNLVFL